MTFEEDFPSLKKEKVIIRECFNPVSRNWLRTESEVVSIGKIQNNCKDNQRIKDAIGNVYLRYAREYVNKNWQEQDDNEPTVKGLFLEIAKELELNDTLLGFKVEIDNTLKDNEFRFKQ